MRPNCKAEREQYKKYCPMRPSSRAERKCCLTRPGCSQEGEHCPMWPNCKTQRKSEGEHCQKRPSCRAERQRESRKGSTARRGLVMGRKNSAKVGRGELPKEAQLQGGETAQKLEGEHCPIRPSCRVEREPEGKLCPMKLSCRAKGERCLMRPGCKHYLMRSSYKAEGGRCGGGTRV